VLNGSGVMFTVHGREVKGQKRTERKKGKGDKWKNKVWLQN